MSLPGGATLTGPTKSARYGMAHENYGRAAGPIPAEIGEPEVGRQGLAATEGGQRRFETRRRVEPTAGGRPGGERSAQHRFLCGTGGIVKGETVFSPFTRSPAKDYPFLPNQRERKIPPHPNPLPKGEGTARQTLLLRQIRPNAT